MGPRGRPFGAELDLRRGRAATTAYARKQCRHCLEPACVSVCPVGALTKTEIGAVVYDSAKCMGCRYCMMACPYGIPRYDWDQAVPYVRKCILCYDRIRARPAAGLHRSLSGQGDHLRRSRRPCWRKPIAESPKAPGRYVNKVWGEHELGGTSVLYISNVDLSFLRRSTRPAALRFPRRPRSPCMRCRSSSPGCWRPWRG